MFRVLFILFLLVPLIEIYFLIKVADVISAGWTIFAVVSTAVIGAGLLRIQGASTLLRAQSSLAKGSLPAMEMMEGFALALSGVLLLTPGFFTDTFGFLLLIPPVRRWLISRQLQNATVVQGSYTSRHSDPTIIEGEVVDSDDEPRLK
ncbi:MAG: exlusion protein FxsA [Methylophaga sp.]|nr:MAG: exlusion protein FxsA [Methylophaga sp.]